MNTLLTTTEGRQIVIEPSLRSLWKYDGFYVRDSYSPQQLCGLCSKPINYCYKVTSPEGSSILGLECVKHVLEPGVLKMALNEYHNSASKINQHRFRTRIQKIRTQIPPGILEVLRIETSRGPVDINRALNTMENKLKLKLYLSPYEVEIIQAVEAQL